MQNSREVSKQWTQQTRWNTHILVKVSPIDRAIERLAGRNMTNCSTHILESRDKMPVRLAPAGSKQNKQWMPLTHWWADGVKEVSRQETGQTRGSTHIEPHIRKCCHTFANYIFPLFFLTSKHHASPKVKLRFFSDHSVWKHWLCYSNIYA